MMRILKAFKYTSHGLVAALHEPAFRQEFFLLCLAIPAVFLLPFPNLYRVLILSAHLLTMIAELLNSGIEKIADLVSAEFHILIKQAKDMGSAAVFLAFCIVGMLWILALWQTFG